MLPPEYAMPNRLIKASAIAAQARCCSTGSAGGLAGEEEGRAGGCDISIPLCRVRPTARGHSPDLRLGLLS
jgi:hypothetical protein